MTIFITLWISKLECLFLNDKENLFSPMAIANLFLFAIVYTPLCCEDEILIYSLY